MEYVQERGMGRNVPGIAVVAILHIVVGYALVAGLARKVVEVIKAPLETRLIEEVRKLPPEPPPPPPPPKLAAPPPPFIPPPEITVQQPQVAPPPAITTAASTPPPVPQASVAPPQPAPAQPAVRRNFKALQRVEPAYPERARSRNISGTVVAHVYVAPNGSVTDVKIVASSNRIFDRDVTNALMQWKFNPEPTGFIGEYEITFKLND